MSLHDVIKLFQYKFWLILLAGLLAGYLALRVMEAQGGLPRYTAEAIIAVGGDAYRDVQDVSYMEMAEAMIANYLEIAAMDIVTNPVAARLGGLVTAEDISRALDVSRIEGTNLVTIRATYENPELVAPIANAVAEELASLAPARWLQFVMSVKAAEVPTAPDRTTLLPIILSVSAGILLALGVILLREFMRQPVYSVEEAVAALNAPLALTLRPMSLSWLRQLAGKEWIRGNDTIWWTLRESCRRMLARPAATQQIPLFSRPSWMAPSDKHSVPGHEEVDAEEAIVILSTAAADHQAQAVAAMQLAHAWDAENDRVLLVDLDLTHPEATRLALGNCPDVGFATLVEKPRTKPTSLLVRDRRAGSGLAILPAGRFSGYSSMAEVEAALDSLIGLLPPPYVMILSAPPPTASLIGLQAATRADLTLVTVEAGRTRHSQMDDLASLLNANDIHVAGLIISHIWLRPARLIASIRRLVASYGLGSSGKGGKDSQMDLETGEAASR